LWAFLLKNRVQQLRWRVLPHAIYGMGEQVTALFIFQTQKSQKKSPYCGNFFSNHNM
jgi:hypothetical protein